MNKNILLSILLFSYYSLSFTQSNFNSEEFLQYRQQIKDMTANEIMQKYPAQNIYYSERQNKSTIEDFQYMDSIDIRYSLTGYEKELISYNHFMVSESL
jgi:ribosomal protein S17E